MFTVDTDHILQSRAGNAVAGRRRARRRFCTWYLRDVRIHFMRKRNCELANYPDEDSFPINSTKRSRRRTFEPQDATRLNRVLSPLYSLQQSRYPWALARAQLYALSLALCSFDWYDRIVSICGIEFERRPELFIKTRFIKLFIKTLFISVGYQSNRTIRLYVYLLYGLLLYREYINIQYGCQFRISLALISCNNFTFNIHVIPFFAHLYFIRIYLFERIEIYL